jgi:serine protease Do
VRVDRIVNATVRDLEVGDVIVELNGASVRDSTALRAELGKAAPGTTALLKLRRGRATRYGALPVPARP